MADMPGRPASEPDGRAGGSGNGSEADSGGWGSPVPAEYGSLRAVRSSDAPPGGAGSGAERTDSTPAAERWGVSSLRRRWSASQPGDRTADGSGRDGPAPTLTSVGDRTPGRDSQDQLTDFERMDGSERMDGAGPASTGRDAAGPGADGSSRVHTDGRGSDGRGSDGRGSDGRGTDGRGSDGRGASAAVAGAAILGRTASSYRAPDGEAPLYEPSGDPFPYEGGSDGPVAADLPTEAIPTVGAGAAINAGPGTGLRPGMGGPSAGGPFGPPGARRRPGRRRSRATIRHVDVLTVLRVSLIFYLVVLVVFVVASLFLWLAADTFGSLPSIEKSVRTLFSLKSFTLHPGTVAFYTGASGLVLAVAGTLWNVLLAFMYNLIADVVGGVRVELESFTKE